MSLLRCTVTRVLQGVTRCNSTPPRPTVLRRNRRQRNGHGMQSWLIESWCRMAPFRRQQPGRARKAQPVENTGGGWGVQPVPVWIYGPCCYIFRRRVTLWAVTSCNSRVTPITRDVVLLCKGEVLHRVTVL